MHFKDNDESGANADASQKDFHSKNYNIHNDMDLYKKSC